MTLVITRPLSPIHVNDAETIVGLVQQMPCDDFLALRLDFLPDTQVAVHRTVIGRMRRALVLRHSQERRIPAQRALARGLIDW